MALSALFWYHCSMESKVKTTSTADEMITISRAEYEALKEHNAELEQKLNWLTEQYILAKHGKSTPSPPNSRSSSLWTVSAAP